MKKIILQSTILYAQKLEAEKKLREETIFYLTNIIRNGYEKEFKGVKYIVSEI